MSTQQNGKTQVTHGEDASGAEPSDVNASAEAAPADAAPTVTRARELAMDAVQDLEDAELAYKRMEPAALALRDDELAAMNVDVVAATSTILGCFPRIHAYRKRAALIPKPLFDIRYLDELVDRAKAAWFAAVTNMPEPEPKEFQAMLEEATKLRQLLLTIAAGLVLAKQFEPAAIAQIKQGSGHKDLASDLVALVTLYRSKWTEVQGKCAVTEADLHRGGELGSALFAMVSLRENKVSSVTEGSLRQRRFWTLADRAYFHCQWVIMFIERSTTIVTTIAPSLRRNSGLRKPAPSDGASTATPLAAAAPVVPQLGGNGSPFIHEERGDARAD